MREAHLSIREASRPDIPKIQIILRQARLSTDDILIEGTRYWLAQSVEGHALGVVGLELREADVLLRSVAVSPSLRSQGLGTSLVQHALDAATGYQHASLFRTGAGADWQRLNFREVAVSEPVAAFPQVPQVKR